MSIEIPEEIKKQWREEFDLNFNSIYKQIHMNYQGLVPLDIKSALKTSYLAAKTSSYEREQELLKENSQYQEIANDYQQDFNDARNEIQKLQDRIKELEKKERERSNPIYSFTALQAIAKREKLIDSGVELLRFSAGMVGRDEWIKEVQELKEGKS